MTTTEKIAGLELRVEQIRNQMNRLLQVASTEAQKDAVTLGHQMMMDEIQEQIDSLKGTS